MKTPPPPMMGPCIFTKEGTAKLIADGKVEIYTAERSQNSVEGEINNAPYIPGPLYEDSEIEQWGVYFPEEGGGLLYTIYYKDDGTLVIAPIAVSTVVNLVTLYGQNPFWALQEMLTEFHGYGEYISKMETLDLSYNRVAYSKMLHAMRFDYDITNISSNL